jgi:LAO/AO transport system kinase
VPEVWDKVVAHQERLSPTGIAIRRAEQQLDFMWALVRDELESRLRRSPGVAAVRDEVRAEVRSGRMQATTAADRILAAFDADRRPADSGDALT